MKVASENFTSGVPCPCEWVNHTVNDNSYCATPNDTTVVSWFIDTFCLDRNYADGIYITYNDSNARQHWYTYVVGREQKALSESRDCHSARLNHHLFLLWDFMCDSGF